MAEWHIYVSATYATIGSGNGLSPVSAKPLSKPMLAYYKLDPWEQTSEKFKFKCKHFHSRKCIWKQRQRNGGHFVRFHGVYTRPCGGIHAKLSAHGLRFVLFWLEYVIHAALFGYFTITKRNTKHNNPFAYSVVYRARIYRNITHGHAHGLKKRRSNSSALWITWICCFCEIIFDYFLRSK